MGINDPAMYRRMSIPFNTRDEGEAAMRAFLDDVRKVREQHKIPNVSLVVRFEYLEPEEESSAIGVSHLGDPMHAESMFAYAYGRESELRKEAIAKAIRGK